MNLNNRSKNFHHLNLCDFYFSRKDLVIQRKSLQLQVSNIREKKISDLEQHVLYNVISDIFKTSKWYNHYYEIVTRTFVTFPKDLSKKYDENKKEWKMLKSLFLLIPSFEDNKDEDESSSSSEKEYDHSKKRKKNNMITT